MGFQKVKNIYAIELPLLIFFIFQINKMNNYIYFCLFGFLERLWWVFLLMCKTIASLKAAKDEETIGVGGELEL